MSTQESHTEYAVRAKKPGGVDTKVAAPSRWGRGYWNRDEAENVRTFALEEEGYDDAWLLSRTVTTTEWERVRDHVAEQDELRKQVRG